MDPRRRPMDVSSIYSDSTGSVWSTTDSVSFVYTDDPDWAWWGYDGVRGAVTRKDDRRDDRRVRFAAHFLRGPFAGQKSKKHHGSSRRHRDRDDDARSDCSSSSGSSTSSRRRGQFSRGPSPMPMPMPPPQHQGYPGSPHPYPQQPPHFDNFGGPPPPPPPPMAMGPPPQQPGFEAGFIQLNGPPAHHDPVWGHNAQYGGEPEVY
ncbi:hypothetical protein GGS24DRAFT_496690 [Hypoxylon argillaceum]|nr:hypothetical protein GGS24DRAFT_496690 [Hypoxylon argillaceum]